MRSLPAHCTQASLFRCLIDFDLCWEHTRQSLSTVLLCLSDPLPAVHQHRGALWGPERGHPGSLRLCSTEASVSQSAHNATLLPLQLAALPPQSPRTACLSTRQGPTCLRSAWVGERCQYWLPIRLAHYLCLTRFFSRPPLPKQGAQASWRESVVEYCKHMCVTCVKWSRNYKFLLPLAWLIKHTLNCIRCKELWVPHGKTVFNIPVCVCMCIYIQCKQYIYSMSWCWET